MQHASFFDLARKAERLRSVSELERFFFRVCGIVQPGLFVDAGASDARTSLRARRHMPDCRIVAVEANPVTYQLHSSDPKFDDKRIEYLHTALGDENGEITFNAVSVDGKLTDDEKGSICVSLDQERHTQPVVVPGARMDTLFAEFKFEHCCIWMDVEGATKKALIGAPYVLSKTIGLFVEVEDQQFWQNQWLAADVMNHLLKADMVPVGRDFQSRYQYNLFFIKRSSLHIPRVRFAYTEYLSRIAFSNKTVTSPPET